MPETEDGVIEDEELDDHDESENEEVVVDPKTEDTGDGS